MHNRNQKQIIICLVVLVATVGVTADVSIAASNGGRTAADFLRIGLGARAAGLGGAFTAVSEGAVASYWNPAGLSSLESKQILLSHFAWYQDIDLEHGSFALPLSEKLVVATSITYLNYGKIDGYDINGVPTGELTAYDWTGGLSVGIGLNDQFSVGVSAKYIGQRLDIYDASAFAFDFGVKYRFQRVILAAVATNIGSEMKFDQVSEKLPAAVRVGLAATPFDNSLIAAIEFEKQVYGGEILRQGIELGFDDRYFLRTGFDQLVNGSASSFASGLSVGAGVRLSIAQFDYAYTPRDKSISEDLHRFSVIFNFGR